MNYSIQLKINEVILRSSHFLWRRYYVLDMGVFMYLYLFIDKILIISWDSVCVCLRVCDGFKLLNCYEFVFFIGWFWGFGELEVKNLNLFVIYLESFTPSQPFSMLALVPCISRWNTLLSPWIWDSSLSKYHLCL